MLTAFALGSILGACTWPLPRAQQPAHSSALHAPIVASRLAQIGFGSAARFGVCKLPECPIRTTKTLAALVPIEATSPHQPSAPAAEGSPSAKRYAVRPTAQLTLLFAPGASVLTSAHKRQLRDALPTLRRSAELNIAGRTDDQGSDPLNNALALARGLSVRDYLLSVDPELPARITIDARGRCCYAAPNDEPASRSLNRRVELFYTVGAGGSAK